MRLTVEKGYKRLNNQMQCIDPDSNKPTLKDLF